MTTSGLVSSAFRTGRQERAIRREQAAKRANARRVARQRSMVAAFTWIGGHLPEAAAVGRAVKTCWYALLFVIGVGLLVYAAWLIEPVAAYIVGGAALILRTTARSVARFVAELTAAKARDRG